MDKAEATAALANMREVAKNPARMAELTAAWNKAVDQLESFYATMRPKPKVFEVHHMNETARYRFAVALQNGQTLDECVDSAVAKIVGA